MRLPVLFQPGNLMGKAIMVQCNHGSGSAALPLCKNAQAMQGGKPKRRWRG
jgi:hypothetical protein